MIISSLSAANLLKYIQLDLNDLPRAGIIAVSGDNESGKSSVGELICFALFGRTFSVAPDELEKLIHWGAFKGSVTLGFEVGDGKSYEVVRFLDREGNVGARLHIAGSEEPIARGAEAVDEALYGIIGFDYEEFLEAFYLAQREIIAPHPRSAALKSISGLGILESLADNFEATIEEAQTAIEDSQQRVDEIAGELEALNLQEGHLASLERDLDKLRVEETEASAGIGELSGALADYERGLEEMLAVQGKRGAAGFFRFLMLVLAVISGAAWFFVDQRPDSELTKLISGFIPPAQATSLLVAAGVFGALFLVFWGRVFSLGAQVNAFREPAKQLAEKLERFHQENQANATPSQAEGASTPEVDGVKSLAIRIRSGMAAREEVHKAVEGELDQMRGGVARIGEQMRGVGDKISVERERVRKGEALRRERDDLQQGIQQRVNANRLREVALELLDGAAVHALQHFNSELRELAARTLPMFTGNNYEHLQIEDDLRLHVFSNKKRDFMDIGEISAGTQRQVMLSLRLALAQELVDKAVKGQQFMFLDEPFAFFDERRTRGTLDVLGNLCEGISQVWVVNQEFPADHQFALHIRCDGDSDTLSLSGPEAGGDASGGAPAVAEPDLGEPAA